MKQRLNFFKNSICPQEGHFKYKDTNKLKVKEWTMIYYVITNQKLMYQTVDFKAKI